MIPGLLRFLQPETPAEATRLMEDQPGAFFLAGGTDVLPLMMKEIRKTESLISLQRVTGLREIVEREQSLFIGSMVRLAELAQNPVVRQHFPSIAQSARSVASPQIRNRATLGGNILQEKRCLYFNQPPLWRKGLPVCRKLGGEVCHQIPDSKACHAVYYSDLAPALLSFEAMAEVWSGGRKEMVPLEDFIRRHQRHGIEKTLLLGVLLHLPGEGTWNRFLKFGTRAAVDFAAVNLAIRCSGGPHPGHPPPRIRIVIGAVSPMPVELVETEKVLQAGFPGTEEEREDLLRMAAEEAFAGSRLIRETLPPVPVKKEMIRGILVEGLDMMLRQSPCV